jgi:hypothetical protein
VTSQPETQSRIWVERSSVRSRFRWEGPLLVLVATVPDLSFVMPSLKARGMWHKPIKLHYSKEFDDLEVPEHVDKIGEVATIQVQFGGMCPVIGKRKTETRTSRVSPKRSNCHGEG